MLNCIFVCTFIACCLSLFASPSSTSSSSSSSYFPFLSPSLLHWLCIYCNIARRRQSENRSQLIRLLLPPSPAAPEAFAEIQFFFAVTIASWEENRVHKHLQNAPGTRKKTPRISFFFRFWSYFPHSFFRQTSFDSKSGLFSTNEKVYKRMTPSPCCCCPLRSRLSLGISSFGQLNHLRGREGELHSAGIDGPPMGLHYLDSLPHSSNKNDVCGHLW